MPERPGDSRAESRAGGGGSRAGTGEGRAGGEEVLRLVGVRKAFGSNLVLDGVHLSVRAGERIAILGRSGCGKSVLLKIIAGLLPPDDGEVLLWGRPVVDLGDDAWVEIRRRLGIVFQAGALFDSLSVFENVAFPLRERKNCGGNKIGRGSRHQREEEIRRTVEERLAWVGLAGTGPLAPSQLSGGMRRRVALARTLAGDPEFILYDEPTSGLDPVTGRRIARLMRDLDRKTHSTSIVVTHDIGCARVVAERWAFLAEGRMIADGAPDALLRSRVPPVAEFLQADALADGPTDDPTGDRAGNAAHDPARNLQDGFRNP